MIEFNNQVHTPEALGQEIATIFGQFPDARLVGSLGRSIIYGSMLGDSEHEFKVREQDPLNIAGLSRDIDLFGVEASKVGSLEPFKVDATGFSTKHLEVVKDGAEWVLIGRCHGFAEPLRPEVVEPFEGEAIFGIQAITLPAQTHLALFGLKGELRDKDVKTKELLCNALKNNPNSNLFPDDFLNPFRQLAAINRGSLYIHAQDTYRRIIPNSLRLKAVPVMRVAKKLIK